MSASRGIRGVATRLGRQGWPGVAPWLGLYAFAAALTLQRIRSHDTWWHLATGRYIVETGSVPSADPFSFTAYQAAWHYSHWLFQVVSYELFEFAGPAGIVIAKLVPVWAMLALLSRIGWRGARPWPGVAALALMLAVASDRFSTRPELWSCAFLALELLVFERYRARQDRWIYAIVPLQLIWVNFHGFFSLGIALCGIQLAGELLRVIGDGIRWDRVRTLGGVAGLSALVSLANPNGLEGALHPLTQLSLTTPGRDPIGGLILELRPTLDVLTPVALALFFALAAGTLTAMAFNWRRMAESDVLLFVAFAYLGISAQRNTAIFAIVAAPLLVRNLNEWLDARAAAGPLPEALTAGPSISSGWNRLASWGGCAALLVLTGVTVSGAWYPWIGSDRLPGVGLMPLRFPVGAADWIDAERPPGPLFHHMADGGYLMWRLFPDYKVMVDGRTPVYGPELFYSLQAYDAERFLPLDARYHFGSILLPYDLLPFDALIRWLRDSEDWVPTYVDDQSLIFVRSESNPQRLDLDSPDLFPPLPGPPSPEDRARRRARYRFFTLMNRPDRASHIGRQAVTLYPDWPPSAQ